MDLKPIDLDDYAAWSKPPVDQMRARDGCLAAFGHLASLIGFAMWAWGICQWPLALIIGTKVEFTSPYFAQMQDLAEAVALTGCQSIGMGILYYALGHALRYLSCVDHNFAAEEQEFYRHFGRN